MNQTNPLHILVIEDSEIDFIIVSERLCDLYKDVNITRSVSIFESLKLISTNFFDVILLDFYLHDSDGLKSVVEVVNGALHTPVIVLTGYGNAALGMEILSVGVEDYLMKDEINGSALSRSINYSIERAKTRIELKKHQGLFKALIEKGTDMKTLITPEGKLLYGTPSITHVLGYTSEEIIGKYEHDFVHPDDIATFFSFIKNIIKKPGESRAFVLRVKHKNGNYHWCEKTITNLLHDSSVNALVCNFWDVTEKMNQIQEIENQNLKLKEIAWIQSHEVRAPIARILGIVNLLKKNTNLDEPTILLVCYLLQAANELDEITKGIINKSIGNENRNSIN